MRVEEINKIAEEMGVPTRIAFEKDGLVSVEMDRVPEKYIEAIKAAINDK